MFESEHALNGIKFFLIYIYIFLSDKLCESLALDEKYFLKEDICEDIAIFFKLGGAV